MESPVASATLNLASWMVPKGEANAAFCERSTTGWRAINAARSCCPTSPDSSSNIMTPRPKGVPRPPSGLLRDATISRLAPAPAKRKQHPPAGKRRRDGANASDFLLAHQACNPVNRPARRHNIAASGAPPGHVGGTMRYTALEKDQGTDAANANRRRQAFPMAAQGR